MTSTVLVANPAEAAQVQPRGEPLLVPTQLNIPMLTGVAKIGQAEGGSTGSLGWLRTAASLPAAIFDTVRQESDAPDLPGVVAAGLGFPTYRGGVRHG